MAEINDLNIVDASNTARFPENQAPSTVNDGARALEGIVARWHKDTNASKASTGTANAYVFAADQALSAYYDGLEIAFDANFTNTGSATLNVDAVAAATIKKYNDQDLAAGDIEAGQKVVVIYDGTNWQMVSPLGRNETPVTTQGDLIQGSSTGTEERLALGTKHYFVGANGTNLGYFGGTSAKTGAYTVASADHDKTILCDATTAGFTITLPAVSIGDGFKVRVKKDRTDTSSNAVTVDADGSELIEGTQTRIIRGLGQMEEYTCDGSEWHVTSPLVGMVLLGRQTASATSNIDFTDMDTTFDHYMLEFMGVRATTDEVEAWLRLSTNNGTSFLSGVSDYEHAQPAGSTTINTDSKIRLTNTVGSAALSNAAGDFLQGCAKIYLPAESSKTHIQCDCSFISASDTAVRQRITWGRYDTAAATDAIRFTLSSGTIAEGEFKFYGIRK